MAASFLNSMSFCQLLNSSSVQDVDEVWGIWVSSFSYTKFTHFWGLILKLVLDFLPSYMIEGFPSWYVSHHLVLRLTWSSYCCWLLLRGDNNCLLCGENLLRLLREPFDYFLVKEEGMEFMETLWFLPFFF